jgi:transposase InsO family protein
MPGAAMLGKIVAAVKSLMVKSARRIGAALRGLLDPRRGATGAVGAMRDVVRTRVQLLAENALLRQQLIAVRRKVTRVPVNDFDRLLMIVLARLTPAWRGILHVVQPETLLRWHRDLFRLFWRRKSRNRGAQPHRLDAKTIELIQSMALQNVLWGAERIRGELIKLGIRVAKRTIQKYMKRARPPGKRGQTWKSFLENHAGDVWACDFLQLYDAFFRPIFAFFIVKHGTREVVHVAVTRAPTDRWTAQQLREATPFGQGPKYLIRDNDGKFGKHFAAVAEGSGIEVTKIPPRSPNLNPICERFLGSVRRECLDHVLILNEDHLRRVLDEYVQYFGKARPHQGLGQRIPENLDQSFPAMRAADVVAIPVLGGLHHDYRRAA